MVGMHFKWGLDLTFSMSLWKEFQLLQILNDWSIKHLIKLILHENDGKLLKFYKKSCIGQFVFTTHLVSHLSLSSVVFIISMLIIGIFYCLDYISLLLHLFITHLVIGFITVTNICLRQLFNYYDLYKYH